MVDLQAFKKYANQALGKPYKYGAKWACDLEDPQGPVDCSGLTFWLLARSGVDAASIPAGSAALYLASYPVGSPSVTDVGFAKNHEGIIEHVIIVYDEEYVIEARGKKMNHANVDVGEKVILRPRKIWEAYQYFTGWRRLKCVDAANGIF